ADLGLADLQRRDLPAAFFFYDLPVAKVAYRSRDPVNGHREMHPFSEILRMNDRVREGVGRAVIGDPEDELAFIADLPVHLAGLESVGQKKRTQPAVKSLDPDPGRETESVKSSRQLQ